MRGIRLNRKKSSSMWQGRVRCTCVASGWRDLGFGPDSYWMPPGPFLLWNWSWYPRALSILLWWALWSGNTAKRIHSREIVIPIFLWSWSGFRFLPYKGKNITYLPIYAQFAFFFLSVKTDLQNHCIMVVLMPREHCVRSNVQGSPASRGRCLRNM